jgi:ribonucleoside-diphosphate reductase alpha chain
MYMLISAIVFAEYPKENRLDYVRKVSTMQSQNTKSTSQHQSWQEYGLRFDNLLSCVLVDVDDTLDSIFS